MKNNLVITIGRENGSGGKYIGERLAKELGVHCYDSSLLKKVADEFKDDIKNLKKSDEKLPKSHISFAGQKVPSKQFEEQAQIITELANRKSCIFIGRASNYILRNYSNVINVFIHAPLDFRIKRYSKRKQISKKEAEKMIKQKDKERANFYKFYTNTNWGDSKNYNISIDTSKVGIDGAIELIKRCIELTGDYNINNELKK